MFSSEIKGYLLRNNFSTFSPKAVFFDMDGVLFDSMKHHAYAWVEALKQVGLPFTEYEAYMNEGRTGSSTINEVFEKQYGREATEEEKQQIYKLKSQLFESRNESEQIPYVFDLLKVIQQQKLQIHIVTGSGQVSLLDNLEKNFPGVFTKERMVTAYDVTNGKPHPEPYLKALEKSGLQAWEVVVIENAPLGVKSAHDAGLFCIAVNTGPLSATVLADNGADIVLEGMKTLHDAWSSFTENWK